GCAVRVELEASTTPLLTLWALFRILAWIWLRLSADPGSAPAFRRSWWHWRPAAGALSDYLHVVVAVLKLIVLRVDSDDMTLPIGAHQNEIRKSGITLRNGASAHQGLISSHYFLQ